MVGTRLLRVFIAGVEYASSLGDIIGTLGGATVSIAGAEVGKSVGCAALFGDIVGALGGATMSLTLGGGVSDGDSTLGAGSSA